MLTGSWPCSVEANEPSPPREPGPEGLYSGPEVHWELGIDGLIHSFLYGWEEESVPSESTEVWGQKVTLEASR